MSLLGNIIWLIFGGFVNGVGYIFGGLLVCLTIIGIPFGVHPYNWALQRCHLLAERSGKRRIRWLSELLFNLIWAVLFGWEIAVSHLVHGLILAITIVGLPFAKQHFKLIPLALFPFGRELQ